MVKAVDFEPSRKTAALADLLIDETLRDRGVVEVGYADGHRWTVGLEERPVEPVDASRPKDAVHLVTGRRGASCPPSWPTWPADGGTFWLLDLAPEPDRDDPDLARVVADRDGLKRDLFAPSAGRRPAGHAGAGGARAGAASSGPRPRWRRSARSSAPAGTVHYRSLDLRDADAVAAVVREVVEAHGRVDVLLHAAGLEISRSLPDKSAEEFALVFDVKVEGWFNLMDALGRTPVGSVMAFSSIAGRFGNAGQTDYAAANDLLCKAMSAAARARRPDTPGARAGLDRLARHRHGGARLDPGHHEGRRASTCWRRPRGSRWFGGSCARAAAGRR